MPDGWESIRWGEVCELKYGKAVPKQCDCVQHDIPVLGTSGVFGWTCKPLSRGPRVIVGRKGTLGIQLAKSDFWTVDTAFWLEESDRLDPIWAYYRLKQIDFKNENSGSAVPSLTRDHFYSMGLDLPPLEEQRRIAAVLETLDDLIEVDRELVEGLLAIVNGEFERRFGQRELSLRLGHIASVIDCLHSKKPDRVESQHRLLQLNNILDSGQLDTDDMYGISAEDYAKWSKNLETQEWDCVITNVGRVGAVARIPAGVAGALGRNMTAIRPAAADVDGSFILAALLSQPVRREIRLKTDSGTVMDALNVKSIPSLRLPETAPAERKDFHCFAQSLLKTADELQKEIRETQATRDELLPLLMSRRVGVSQRGAA